MTSQRKLICVLAHPDNESLGNSQKGAAMMQFKEPEIAMGDGQRLAYEEFNYDILAFFERPDGTSQHFSRCSSNQEEVYHEREQQPARFFESVEFGA